jgi:hypothetical protein
MKPKIIIWGHKLHTHTHSYVHGAYHKAFSFLGYESYWLDNDDNVDSFDFSNSIFLTEGQVDQKIPLRKDCKYITHFCDDLKYNDYNRLKLGVYTNGKEKSAGVKGEQIEPYVYYDKQEKMLYQPWATDLLPTEIEDTYYIKDNKIAGFIGSIGGGYYGNLTEIDPFVENCKKHSYNFVYYLPGSCSFESNKLAIRDYELAPTIVGQWQKINGYIPCRIFKNISYGKLGVTNSEAVHDLFEENTVYSADTSVLLDKYLTLDESIKLNMFNKSLNLVKNRHTYLNRICNLLKFL